MLSSDFRFSDEQIAERWEQLEQQRMRWLEHPCPTCGEPKGGRAEAVLGPYGWGWVYCSRCGYEVGREKAEMVGIEEDA